MTASQISLLGPQVLEPWSPAAKKAYLEAPIVFTHRLAESDLFTDDALAGLLDRYPEDAIDINRYDFDEDGQATLQTGTRAGVDGRGLLNAVRAGRLWLNCKHIMDLSPEIASLVRAAFNEISAMRPDFQPRKIWGQLLISSPATKVPYHADPSGVILFHLKGRKRIYVYPADETHVPTTELEKIITQQQTEELPYQRSMDAGAQVFDLEPGQAVAWPLFAPHRVENLSSFCVSLSIDYLTREQQIETGAHYTNFVLRRLGIHPPRLNAMPMAAKTAFWVAAGGLKRMGVIREKLSAIPRNFTLKPDARENGRMPQLVGREAESL